MIEMKDAVQMFVIHCW